MEVDDPVRGGGVLGDQPVDATVDQVLDVVGEHPHPLGRERRGQQPAHPRVVGLLGVVVARGAVQDGGGRQA
jgi:hypothetical protein